MVTLFIKEEEGAEEEIEEEENGWVKGHLKEKQSEGLGEVLPMEMEEEMGEDSIPRLLWKEIIEIDRRRNGQVQQMMEEEGETILLLPLQYKNHKKGPKHRFPSEDRFCTDWSSIGMGSTFVRHHLEVFQ